MDKIKLYIIHPENKQLYMCRFPASLDVDSAIAKGWKRPKEMQKLFKIANIKTIAVEIKFNPNDLKEKPNAAKQLTQEIHDDNSRLQSTSKSSSAI